MHMFQAPSFRDYAASELKGKPILIEPLDGASAKIGLGWKVKARGSDSEMVEGATACKSFLNDLVKLILDDLCSELNAFDRRAFVDMVLRNYEIACHDRDRWYRSAQANVALHDKTVTAIDTVMAHVSRLNACLLASRILLEAALCE